MLPLIGVSTYVADVAWGNWERRAAVLPASYFELVAAAGGRPLLIPPTSTSPGGPEAGADQVIEVLDALVLTGGATSTPAPTARSPIPRWAASTPNRDASERALLAAALEADMPVLAICRGCQVLNVYLGGSLHQHLPDVVGNLDHRKVAMHFEDVDVATEPGTRTADVFGPSTTVRCSHHQAIRDLGRDLVVPPGPGTASSRRSSCPRPASSWPSSGTPKSPWTSGPSTPWSGRPGLQGRTVGRGHRLSVTAPTASAGNRHMTSGLGSIPGPPGKVPAMAKSGHKVVKPVAAAAVTLGTIASIWWFASKPRRKAKAAGGSTAEK